MSVKGVSAALPSIPGSRELARWAHVRAEPNLALNGDVVYPVSGLPSVALPWVQNGGVFTRQFVDQRYCYRLAPTLLAGGSLDWKGLGTTEQRVLGFRDRWDAGSGLGALEAASPEGGAYAFCVQAWLRKLDNVNPVWARARFGVSYTNLTGLGNSSRKPTVGVIGDGVVGFRCGSVHCPDGVVGGGPSAANAIDAGAVQPAVLVNPGLAWFHVRVKMVPPTLASPAAVGVYVNGRLVFQSSALANFPRGGNGVNQNYQQLEAGMFADFDAVTQLNGLLASGFEVWYDGDLSL